MRASIVSIRIIGVWAPSLSHHDGLFYLIYTTVRTRVGPFKDVRIFLATAPGIAGPWSDPIDLGGEMRAS